MHFYDPADMLMNNINGKPTHLVFHADSVQNTNVEDAVLVKIDPHFCTALPRLRVITAYCQYFLAINC
jgi:hypothetical protein